MPALVKAGIPGEEGNAQTVVRQPLGPLLHLLARLLSFPAIPGHESRKCLALVTPAQAVPEACQGRALYLPAPALGCGVQGVVLRWAAPPSLFLFAGFHEIAVDSHIVVRCSTELVHCLEFSNGNRLQN